MIRAVHRLALLFWLLPAAALAQALFGTGRSIPGPSALCRTAISQAERATGVPNRLLDAIAIVESGRRDPVSGAVYPWPWTINVEGVGHIYDTKAEVIAAVQAFQAEGARSIDVGCMQVNLLAHANAFPSLDAAFDPVTNANYGAHFLQTLFNQLNAWPRAVAAYHSMNPELGNDYARKVLAAWGVPQPLLGGGGVQTAAAAAMAALPPLPGPSPSNRVAVLLPNGNEAIHVMPLRGGNSQPGLTARGLDSYRAVPIALSRTARAF